jgi:hypothetical protein
MNLVGVGASLFAPWWLFCFILALMSFHTHYESPPLAKASVFFGLGLAVLMVFLSYKARKRNADPMWYHYCAIAMLIASVTAGLLGDMNYWQNMNAFYQYENLDTYVPVNPSTQRGQQLMDSARVYFTAGTKLDLTKTVAFKNQDIYCVAPISDQPPDKKLPSYDYWAVGINCCSGVANDFRCGEFNNPHARAGLRLMRDDQRPFFRLAVQQAEAAYGIKSSHPLFFYWLQDPVAEQSAYRDDGWRLYYLGMLGFFCVNLFCVGSTACAFAKLGFRE